MTKSEAKLTLRRENISALNILSFLLKLKLAFSPPKTESFTTEPHIIGVLSSSIPDFLNNASLI